VSDAEGEDGSTPIARLYRRLCYLSVSLFVSLFAVTAYGIARHGPLMIRRPGGMDDPELRLLENLQLCLAVALFAVYHVNAVVAWLQPRRGSVTMLVLLFDWAIVVVGWILLVSWLTANA